MADETKPEYHPVAWLGQPKNVPNPVEGRHVFDPDHNMYCNACGYGELDGDHGMIPGDGGASGTDFSPMYENDEVWNMYNDALGLSGFEDTRPDWPLRHDPKEPTTCPFCGKHDSLISGVLWEAKSTVSGREGSITVYECTNCSRLMWA